ncbi:MAG TPA: DMT family transporter [Candidatus Nitrosocosmicus sp.]|nr:DMT family transporter [Candidatus Nitrosocosmicus sp.]
MEIHWIILAALAGILSNAYHILTRIQLKDGDDLIIFGWLFEITMTVVFGILYLFNPIFYFDVKSIFFLLLLGFSEVGSIYFYTKMHANAHLSISSIISRTRLIWIPLIAFIFLGEALEIKEYIGIAILFFGISFITSPKHLKSDKGVRYSIFAAFFASTNSIFLKASSYIKSTPLVMLGMSIPAAILIPFFAKDFKKRLVLLLKKNPILKISSQFTTIAGMYLLFEALKVGPVSKVTGIYQSMMIVSVLFGIIFLKEREDIGKKLIGSVIVIAGVLLLTAF